MPEALNLGIGDVYGPGGQHAASPWAGLGLLPALTQPLALAGLIRISLEDLQNPRESALRQVRNNTRRLPPGWTISVWYVDVESGRMELADRGLRSNADLAHLDLPVDRAGGLPDLLRDAAQPDRAFDAVICEGAERLARLTYLSAGIEHQLQTHGVPLYSADEPIDAGGKKATQILTRRMKQVVGEFWAIQTMEQAWDNLVVHTEEGWNIGRAPYGYRADRIKHPVPGRAALGRTKSRLTPDPIRGPVVTQLFNWRAHGLAYIEILRRLDADPASYPPPEGVGPRARGRWSHSTLHGILANPKYTGYMVWNRSTTRTGLTVKARKYNRPNPPEQWVWSPQPVHPPLTDLDTYRRVQQRATEASRAGSRPGSGDNPHPATRRAYLYRSFVYCPRPGCGLRMTGAVRRGHTYYRCAGRATDRNHRRDPDHGSPYIREDILNTAIHAVLTERVFGPHRAQHLARQLAAAPTRDTTRHHAALTAAHRRLDDITAKQDRLVTELTDTTGTDPTGNAWRARLRNEFTQLETERAHTAAELTKLQDTTPTTRPEPALLDALPQTTGRLADLPPTTQRHLYEALRLEIHPTSTDQALVRITLTTDTPDQLADIGIEDPTTPTSRNATSDPIKRPRNPVGDARRFPMTTVECQRRRSRHCVPRRCALGGRDGGGRPSSSRPFAAIVRTYGGHGLSTGWRSRSR